MTRTLLIAWIVLVCAAAASAGGVQTAFSLERAERTLRDLSVGIGPRPMGSAAEREALTYARDAFLAAGCDTAYVMPMSASSRANTSSGVAVGIRRGATDRIIVIGGHIDSAGPEIPGADDDGSGSAIVMEIARVHAHERLQSTIVYCCFGGEEEGLEGSRFFVENFPRIDSVVLMLQLDMANGLGLIDMDPETHGAMAPAWLTRAAVEEFQSLGYTGLRYPTHFFAMNYAMAEGSGSDHEPFLRKGIPAIDFSTDVSRPIHTPQDNFENFDVRGLKRSGDLALALAKRFDGGVPSRETEQYWLYLVGNIPVMVPIWGVWLFGAVSLLLGIGVVVRARAHRLKKTDPGYAGWSSLKIWLLGVVIVAAGWCSSDLLGLVRGLRHPWMTQIGLYTILGFLVALLAAWAVARLQRFRLSADPYPLLRTWFIVLALLLVAPGMLSAKLLMPAAAALFLGALAMLVGPAPLRLALLLFSPVWLLRLVFSEWDGLLFRSGATGLPPYWWTALLMNGFVVLLLSFLLLPFFLNAIALLRVSPGLARIAEKALGRAPGAGLALAAAALAVYVSTLPSYDRFWMRNVRVIEKYAMETGVRSVELVSGEFLTGTRVTHGGKDTLIEGRTASLTLTPAAFDTTLARVSRDITTLADSDHTVFNGVLRIDCARRPLSVAVRYTGSTKTAPHVSTPWHSGEERGATVIQWRHFPDTVLVIPVKFTTEKGDSVRESVEVVFAHPADPVTLTGELLSVVARTTYTSEKVYR